MDHKFISKAWVRETDGHSYGKRIDIPSEILMLGVMTGDKILHVGACDDGLNLIESFENNGIDLFYLGVDVKDSIKELGEKYKDVDHYSFIQQSVQELIDEELSDQSGAMVFNYTILTGIFNKPAYEDKHYLFMSTLIDRCMKFSERVVFTLDASKYNEYNYSVLYVMNNLINMYDSVTIKKLKKDNYIFCITH